MISRESLSFWNHYLRVSHLIGTRLATVSCYHTVTWSKFFLRSNVFDVQSWWSTEILSLYNVIFYAKFIIRRSLYSINYSKNLPSENDPNNNLNNSLFHIICKITYDVYTMGYTALR